MSGKIKVKGVPMKVHPDFQHTIEMIHSEVISERRKQRISGTISFSDISKVITNLINANPKIKDMVNEAILNGKRN